MLVPENFGALATNTVIKLSAGKHPNQCAFATKFTAKKRYLYVRFDAFYLWGCYLHLERMSFEADSHFRYRQLCIDILRHEIKHAHCFSDLSVCKTRHIPRVTNSNLVKGFTVAFTQAELHLSDSVLYYRQRWTRKLQLILHIAIVVLRSHSKLFLAYQVSCCFQFTISRVKGLKAGFLLTLFEKGLILLC